MSVDKTLKALGLRKKTPGDKVREAGKNLNARFAKLRGATPESRARAAGARFGLDRRPVILAALWLVFADRGATSPRAVYAAFARKRNVRRGLWRQPNVASMAEQLALSDYKTPAARRATRS